MSIFENFMNKLFAFEKEPQKIGLSQFKDTPIIGVIPAFTSSNKKGTEYKNKESESSNNLKKVDSDSDDDDDDYEED